MNTANKTKFHLDNSKIALRYWMTVPPENVMPQLGFWFNHRGNEPVNCGTIACFGGWCSVMPEFVALGVSSDPMYGGAPRIKKGLHKDDLGVSKFMFGCKDMFAPSVEFLDSFYCEYDRTAPKECTDHELVQHRIIQNIKRLEYKLSSRFFPL